MIANNNASLELLTWVAPIISFINNNLKHNVVLIVTGLIWLLKKFIGQTLFLEAWMVSWYLRGLHILTCRQSVSSAVLAAEPASLSPISRGRSRSTTTCLGALHRSNQGHKTLTAPPLFPRAAGSHSLVLTSHSGVHSPLGSSFFFFLALAAGTPSCNVSLFLPPEKYAR